MIDEENDTGDGKEVAMFHIMLYDKDGETGKKLIIYVSDLLSNVVEW